MSNATNATDTRITVIAQKLLSELGEEPGQWFTLMLIIRGLTDANDHSGAVKTLAETFGEGWKETNVIDSIITISAYANSTPGDLVELRNRILKSLLVNAQSKMTIKEHEALRLSF